MVPASFIRRLIAMFYDALILLFIIVLASFLIQQLIIELELMTLEQVQISAKETILMIPSDSIANLMLKNLWVLISFAYFGYYWTSRGYTPGMGVWKLKITSSNATDTTSEQLISWKQVIYRYVFALLGFGLFVQLFHKENKALQDILSQSSMISTKV